MGNLFVLSALRNPNRIGSISHRGSQFMTMEVLYFYLMTPPKQPEYIHIRLTDIPDKVIKGYKLCELAMDGSVYNMTVQGMYGLLQAILMARKLLEKRLNIHGYRQSKLVPGIWKHD